jgi:hypothetical protein
MLAVLGMPGRVRKWMRLLELVERVSICFYAYLLEFGLYWIALIHVDRIRLNTSLIFELFFL